MPVIMDKQLLTIISVFVMSLIWGQMDKIKFHYSKSIFSTFGWQGYFNPSKKPEWIKGDVLMFLFTRSALIGFADFWHMLKGLILEIILFNFVYLNGWNWGLFILLNLIYWGVFEFSFVSLNKKL